MMAMLKVVAVFAFIAATGAKIEEFSEDALKDAGLIYSESTSVKASLINPNIEMEFLEKDQGDDYAVRLFSKPLPELQKNGLHKDCGSAVGIELTESNQVFCNVAILDIVVNMPYNGEKYSFLTLNFRSETTQPLVLDIPIFQVPAQMELDNEDDETQETKTEVGVSPPVDSKKVAAINVVEPIKMSFDWLKEVLEYGLTKSNRPVVKDNKVIDTFYTHPIVVSSTLAEEIFKACTADRFINRDLKMMRDHKEPKTFDWETDY